MEKNIKRVIEKLTVRQYQVFKLVGKGKTSKEIGLELGISEKTVQNIRATICAKLNLEGYGALYHLALKIRLRRTGDDMSTF